MKLKKEKLETGKEKHLKVDVEEQKRLEELNLQRKGRYFVKLTYSKSVCEDDANYYRATDFYANIFAKSGADAYEGIVRYLKNNSTEIPENIFPDMTSIMYEFKYIEENKNEHTLTDGSVEIG